MAYVHARHTHNVKMWRYTLLPALTSKVYGLDRPLEPVPTPPDRCGSISIPLFGRYIPTNFQGDFGYFYTPGGGHVGEK